MNKDLFFEVEPRDGDEVVGEGCLGLMKKDLLWDDALGGLGNHKSIKFCQSLGTIGFSKPIRMYRTLFVRESVCNSLSEYFFVISSVLSSQTPSKTTSCIDFGRVFKYSGISFSVSSFIFFMLF